MCYFANTIVHDQTGGPLSILCNYYVTYRCNAYCDFCHFGDHEQFRGSRHARKSDILRNLSGLRRLGVRFIDFTGGEPLLHPDLAECCRAAKREGMQTSITTNGLLYPKAAGELRGLVDLLHFSLDSADREEHDALRGVRCFDSVIESIELALSMGERPDLIFTVTGENFRQLDGVYAIAERHGLQLLINPVFEYFRSEPLAEAALAAAERVASLPLAYMNPSLVTLRRMGGNDIGRPLCKAVSRVIVISPRNELLLPCYHQHYERIPIGEDIVAAHGSERVRWHERMQGRHEFCSGCTINCYFEPSFAFPVNALSFASVPSKVKYGFNKYVRQPLRRSMDGESG